MLRASISAPKRDVPHDGHVARRLNEITPGVASGLAVTLRKRFVTSAFSRMIGFGITTPVSFSTIAVQPSVEKVGARK